jgi:hypothetical protein
MTNKEMIAQKRRDFSANIKDFVENIDALSNMLTEQQIDVVSIMLFANRLEIQKDEK